MTPNGNKFVKSDMTGLVLVLFFMTDFLLFKVCSASVLAPKNQWKGNNAFRRNGVFLRLEELKPSISPTLESGTNSNQGYKQLASNTLINNNDTTTPTKPRTREQQMYHRNMSISDQNSQSDLRKVDLVQPESFPKPTSIPPIGKLLVETSPTSQIKPIESQLLSIKKPESFGPITEQLVAAEKVSRIEDMPKIPDIDSMENIFKNHDINEEYKEFKRNIINKTSVKKTHKGFITSKPIFTIKRLQKAKKTRLKFLPSAQNSNRLVRIKRHLWTPRTRVKDKHGMLMIAPCDTHFTFSQLKKRVQKFLVKAQNGRKKVFIPPPPPIQMKSLEPFTKEKAIEDISKETIQVDKPEPIEGIDQHLQTIDKQPEVKPISDHLIENEPFKAFDDIEPKEPITAVESH